MTNSRLLFAWLVLALAWNQKTVISAHVQAETRCSHVPPAPDQVNHVWLGRADDSGPSPAVSFVVDDGNDSSAPNKSDSSPMTARARRHIKPKSIANQLRTVATTPSSPFDTLWNLFRKPERQPPAGAANQKPRPGGFQAHDSIVASPDDLVPMKIQIFYDESVFQLDKKRLKSIKETVMPSVVKFFEEVLLIRREYTIDRFRISRRCPNNTIYYTKDGIGLSRPFCMDRCEDHAVCGEITVPKEHLAACSYCNTTSRRCTTNYASEGQGAENTQLLLYVSARQTVRCRRDQTIAYAAHCAQDTKTDRPVAGHANLCPNSISTDPKDLKALIATVKHELTHVLGFSVSLFAYYRDSDGQPLTRRESSPGPIPVDPRTGYAKWSDKVIKRVVRTDWVTGDGTVEKEVHMVVTPTVVREVRKHFNCSMLEGAELEDQGSDGTSMTHWEKRLFENEAMTGTHTQNSVYSRITLAVLQDTGWYVANFTSADRLDWGKDLGCDFARKSCKSWIDERRAQQLNIRPFCDRIKGDLLQIGCTEDRGSKAVCNMRHYKEPLPSIYRNFDQLEGAKSHELAHFGGSVDLADYCPFIQEFTWQVQNVTVRGSRCDLGGTSIEAEKNAALEHYGHDSRCFEHGRRWEQKSCIYRRHWHHFGAGCYKFTCDDGHVNVHVGNHSYPCYYTDQVIHIHQIVNQWLYNGSLVCPACDKICPPNKCVTYDKRLIDRITNLSQLAASTNSNNTLEILRQILDEHHNEVDTGGANMVGKKSFSEYKNMLAEMSKQVAMQNLLTFPLGDHYMEASHYLICSSAETLILYSTPISCLTTIVALYLIAIWLM